MQEHKPIGVKNADSPPMILKQKRQKELSQAVQSLNDSQQASIKNAGGFKEYSLDDASSFSFDKSLPDDEPNASNVEDKSN